MWVRSPPRALVAISWDSLAVRRRLPLSGASMRQASRHPDPSSLLPLFCWVAVACGSSEAAGPAVGAAAEVVVTPASVSLSQLASTPLTVRVFDELGREIANPPLIYTPGNPALVSVSVSGLVTSKGPAGSTSVLVRSDTASAAVPVTVTQVPTSIQTRNPLRLPSGSSIQLEGTVLDAVNVPMPSEIVVFSSTASGITVTGAGLVTSLGPTGPYTVRATSGSVSTDVLVVVPTHPTGTQWTNVALQAGSWGVAVSPFGVAYLTGPGALALLRLNLPSLVAQPTVPGTLPNRAFEVAFSSDGAYAFAPSLAASSMSIVDVAANQVVGQVMNIPDDQRSVAVAPSDSIVFVGGGSDTLYVINVHSRTIVQRTNLGHHANALVFSPDGRMLYGSSPEGHVVMEIDASSYGVVRTFPVGGQPQGIAISPDGALLYVANELGWVLVWDMEANVARDSVALPGGPFGLAMTPDAVQLYVTLPDTSTTRVAILDRLTLGVLAFVPVPAPRRVAFTFLGDMAVVANGTSGATVIQ